MKRFMTGRRACAALALTSVCLGCSSEPATPPQDAAPAAVPGGAGEDARGPGTVTGQVPVTGGQPSFIVLQPATPRELPQQTEPPVMDQVSQIFIPGILLVRTGQPSEFRNNDDVLHNVRVREVKTREGAFNVAIPTGGHYQYAFKRDGFYDVGCDIHPGMSATILASSSPYMTVSDVNGNFEIPDVPAGSYSASIYVGADEIHKPVDVGAGHTELHFTQ